MAGFDETQDLESDAEALNRTLAQTGTLVAGFDSELRRMQTSLAATGKNHVCCFVQQLGQSRGVILPVRIHHNKTPHIVQMNHTPLQSLKYGALMTLVGCKSEQRDVEKVPTVRRWGCGRIVDHHNAPRLIRPLLKLRFDAGDQLEKAIPIVVIGQNDHAIHSSAR